MFEGTHTALVTPFKNREIDEPALRRLIDAQFDNGVSGVVPVGTTGESPTLSHDEHQRVIEIAIEQTNKRGIVIAGTGSNSTREAISLTTAAEKAAADAALLVCPYYNKPNQEGLFQHYKSVAEATNLKLVLYSIPGRSVIKIDVETTARLHEACPNICAMKEAGGEVQRVVDLRAALPDEFEVVSGDDALTLPFMEAGGVGVISVASNLIPKVMADLTTAMREGRQDEARAIHEQYEPLFNAFLKLDTNPVPIKAALALTGACEPDLRLPMVPLPEEKVAELKATLKTLEIL